jgi:hypothetical protein
MLDKNIPASVTPTRKGRSDEFHVGLAACRFERENYKIRVSRDDGMRRNVYLSQ